MVDYNGRKNMIGGIMAKHMFQRQNLKSTPCSSWILVFERVRLLRVQKGDSEEKRAFVTNKFVLDKDN